MHVSQVEHGLSAVLLLRGQSVVNDCRLIVHICPEAIEVVVAQLYPRHSVPWEEEGGEVWKRKLRF